MFNTNILVYAHRVDSEWHEPARSRIRELAEGRVRWGLPWPCIHEFIAIASHPKIYDPPSSMAEALDQVEAWIESPIAELLAETGAHWTVLKEQLLSHHGLGDAP